jgi:polyribonucleotide nucleotidyltransferase
VLAQKASGSVLITQGDNVVLATVTMSKPREGIDFFPLTVDIEERHYAIGQIPGSFFRREGRPTTQAILTCRLIDRPIRPLFPKGFKNEVQVIATTLSSDKETPLDIMALNGVSTALSISNIPFNGPLAATRMGYIDGEFISNPSYAQLEESLLDIVVASSKDGVSMMEAGVKELDEATVYEAIEIAHNLNLETIALQEEFVSMAGKAKTTFTAIGHDPLAVEKARSILGNKIYEALKASDNQDEMKDQINVLEDELKESLAEEFDSKVISGAFEELLDEQFRVRILKDGIRPDNRGPKEIRNLSADVGLLPRTHGSGLFNRGETQILGVTTLGSSGDAQKIDNLSPETSKNFMVHYNFPPYSVGEAGRVGSPGRREVGHGALTERALTAVLPKQEDFPYTIRIVCEALSSNGSTSMGSVCASTLSLMDAGVPISSPVAGISIGLITGNDNEYVTLTDIQGLEDHVGDMDFKVAGTSSGITAIQLDIKVNSISFDVIKDALSQAKEARSEILDVIKKTIPNVREDINPYAPRIQKIMVPVSKIGAVIGPGGKMIRSIVEETGATVDIQDDGTVLIGSADLESADKAIQMVKDLTREIAVGEIFTGKVAKIAAFGAFVSILPGTDGMVHISELDVNRVGKVEDIVNLGDEITVKVINIDNTGKIKLSRKAVLDPTSSSNSAPETPVREKVAVKTGDIITGKVVNITKYGAFVEIAPGTDGMVHISELENYRVSNVEDVVNIGDEITVEVIEGNESGDRIKLSRKSLLTD